MALVNLPRSVFVDFPLGRQCGKPNDTELQMSILRDALDTLVKANAPGQIVDLSYEWEEPFDWESFKQDVEAMIAEERSTAREWSPKS
jgi:hypothetical protein